MNLKNDETQNYYDGIAKGYKDLYHMEQKLKISKIKSEFDSLSGKFLDIGCGDGVLNTFLPENVELYSLDISSELLKLNPNVDDFKFHCSCEELPFEDNFFDYASSFTVFQDLNNPKKAVREAYRVLKCDGKFFLSFLHISRHSDLIVNEIFKYFKIVEKIKEEKDYIFVLEKKC